MICSICNFLPFFWKACAVDFIIVKGIRTEKRKEGNEIFICVSSIHPLNTSTPFTYPLIIFLPIHPPT